MRTLSNQFASKVGCSRKNTKEKQRRCLWSSAQKVDPEILILQKDILESQKDTYGRYLLIGEISHKMQGRHATTHRTPPQNLGNKEGSREDM